VEPVSETPTEFVDYALLSVAYGTALAALAARAAGREAIPPRELVPLSAATFALSKLVVHEKVETWLRRPFVDERPDGRRPKGRRMRYALGELLSCTRCLGAWGALGLVALRSVSPAAASTVTAVLAVSAGNDFLHTSFALLCSRSNAEERRASAPAPLADRRRAA
jgi:Protein of unknown function (DUF1360)